MEIVKIKMGDRYFFVSKEGEVRHTNWYDMDIDHKRGVQENVFLKKEDAEAAALRAKDGLDRNRRLDNRLEVMKDDLNGKIENLETFEENVQIITNDIKYMLISKNKKYGNSALEPKRIFSSANPVEQIKVRIDDKLSRIANQTTDEDEDVINDLIGYLVLLKIATQ